MADSKRSQATGIEQTAPESRPHQPTVIGMPGVEFPAVVYGSVIAAFGCIVVVAWLAFGGGPDADLSLGIATALALVFFALPVIMYKVAAARCDSRCAPLADFLESRVDIATGSLSGREAWLQVLIIPGVLVFAAVAIGAVWVLAA